MIVASPKTVVFVVHLFGYTTELGGYSFPVWKAQFKEYLCVISYGSEAAPP